MSSEPNLFRPVVIDGATGVVEPYRGGDGRDFFRQQSVTHTVHESYTPTSTTPAAVERVEATGLPSHRLLTAVANFLVVLAALLIGAVGVALLLLVIRIWGALT